MKYMVKALTHILKLLSWNRKCWFNSFLNSLIVISKIRYREDWMAKSLKMGSIEICLGNQFAFLISRAGGFDCYILAVNEFMYKIIMSHV